MTAILIVQTLTMGYKGKIKKEKNPSNSLTKLKKAKVKQTVLMQIIIKS